MRPLAQLVRLGRRLSFAMSPPHQEESNVFSMYRKCAQVILGRSTTRIVADIGGGRDWQFSANDKQSWDVELVALDISGDELDLNQVADSTVVADVTKEIPVADGSIDLIMCHSGVEHFSDNAGFLSNAYNALRPGGRMILQFPSPYAPFAILNRAFPPRLTAWLLKNFMPGSEGVLGFKAYYDRTDYVRFRKLAENAGLEVDYHFPGFFSAGYFAFFPPMYLVLHIYDLLRFALGSRALASYNLFVLRRPGGPEDAITW